MADQGAEGLFSPFLRARRIAAARPFMRGRVLDAGCGVGELARFIEPGEYFGFDIDSECIHTARLRHPDHCFDSVMPDRREKFDTVAALAVIEHVPDPTAFLSALNGYLRDKAGSRIVLTTPHPSMNNIHTIGSRIGLFSAHGREEHKELLDYAALVKVSDAAGLKVAVYWRFLFWANQLSVLNRK